MTEDYVPEIVDSENRRTHLNEIKKNNIMKSSFDYIKNNFHDKKHIIKIQSIDRIMMNSLIEIEIIIKKKTGFFSYDNVFVFGYSFFHNVYYLKVYEEQYLDFAINFSKYFYENNKIKVKIRREWL